MKNKKVILGILAVLVIVTVAVFASNPAMFQGLARLERAKVFSDVPSTSTPYIINLHKDQRIEVLDEVSPKSEGGSTTYSSGLNLGFDSVKYSAQTAKLKMGTEDGIIEKSMKVGDTYIYDGFTTRGDKYYITLKHINPSQDVQVEIVRK